jgi:hypothetical protein
MSKEAQMAVRRSLPADRDVRHDRAFGPFLS